MTTSPCSLYADGKLIASQPTQGQGVVLAKRVRAACEANVAAGLLDAMPVLKLVADK